MPFSDVVSPLPDQPDPGALETYASDYDYGSLRAQSALACMGGWTGDDQRRLAAECVLRYRAKLGGDSNSNPNCNSNSNTKGDTSDSETSTNAAPAPVEMMN